MRYILIILCSVIFVNGATDAVCSVASAVSSGALSVKGAVRLAAVFNFIGMIVMTMAFPMIINSMILLADFGADTVRDIAAALIASVVWAVSAWIFGIPTSESHALIAALWGASAYGRGLSSINAAEALRVFIWLLLSCVIGYAAGHFFSLYMSEILRGTPERRLMSYQRIGAAGLAFWHGAQDGQKFVGIYLLLMGITKPDMKILLIFSLIMAFGTLVGGKKIINKIGHTLTSLNPCEGLSSDVSSSLCLLAATMCGAPVSTTHVKICSVMGAGRHIDRRSAGELICAWTITFPACMLMGYFFVWIFNFIL